MILLLSFERIVLDTCHPQRIPGPGYRSVAIVHLKKFSANGEKSRLARHPDARRYEAVLHIFHPLITQYRVLRFRTVPVILMFAERTWKTERRSNDANANPDLGPGAIAGFRAG